MLQKIQKYAFQLLLLQGLIVMSLLYFLYLQHLQSVEEKESLIQVIVHYQEPFGHFLNVRKEKMEMRMENQVWEMELGQEYVGCVSEIREYTENLQKEIDKAIVSEALEINGLSFDKTINGHKEFVLKSLEELNLKLNEYSEVDEADLSIIEEIYSNPLVNDSHFLMTRHQKIRTRQSYLTYLTKLKNDLKFVEDKVIILLWAKMPRRYFRSYDLIVQSQNLIERGDTLKTIIFLAESIPVQGKLMIGKDIIKEGRLDGETYQIRADKLGKHQIEGALITKDGYGQTKTYPFTHKYTVLPKCN